MMMKPTEIAINQVWKAAGRKTKPTKIVYTEVESSVYSAFLDM